MKYNRTYNKSPNYKKNLKPSNINLKNVFIVLLRRPKGKDDKRNDPFWEFGSFGSTGCHRAILRYSKELNGARLAFAQGGSEGFKLVHLTSPITERPLDKGKEIKELHWKEKGMPFKYKHAPLLISNNGKSDFVLLKDYIGHGRRSSLEGQFASNFRGRNKKLDTRLAEDIIYTFLEWKSMYKGDEYYATHYTEALPYFTGDKIADKKRKEIYNDLRGLKNVKQNAKDRIASGRC